MKRGLHFPICALLSVLFSCAPVLKSESNKAGGAQWGLLLLAGLNAGAPSASSAHLEIVSQIRFPFVTPYAIAIDSNDNLYVSDGCFFRESWGGTTYTAETFGLYLSGDYSSYPDCGVPQYRILKFDRGGQYSGWIAAGTDGISGLHAAAGPSAAVRTYSPWVNTNAVTSWMPGELNRIRSLKVDSDGTLYALEANRIHKFTGPNHDFTGTIGWGCNATCQTLISQADTIYRSAMNGFDACATPLDPNDTAGYQACFDAYTILYNAYQQKAAEIHAEILATGASAWRTDPSVLVVDFPPSSAPYIGASHAPAFASGLAIRGNELWIGTYCWCSAGGEIRVFDKNTASLQGWYGRSRHFVNSAFISEYFGYRAVSDYGLGVTGGIVPVHAPLHSSSPGAFSTPRDLQWFNNRLYIVDNTSDPVISVAELDGTIVQKRSHSSGDKPFALTVNQAGYMLTSNMYTGTIQIFDPELKEIGSLSVESASSPNVWYPIAAAGFAWDSQGYVYFTSTTSNAVYKARLVLD